MALLKAAATGRSSPLLSSPLCASCFFSGEASEKGFQFSHHDRFFSPFNSTHRHRQKLSSSARARRARSLVDSLTLVADKAKRLNASTATPRRTGASAFPPPPPSSR